MMDIIKEKIVKIKNLQADYIKVLEDRVAARESDVINLGQGNWWAVGSVSRKVSRTKIKRLRLMIQEEMLELEKLLTDELYS